MLGSTSRNIRVIGTQMNHNRMIWSKVVDFFSPKTSNIDHVALRKENIDVFQPLKVFSDAEYGGGSDSQHKIIKEDVGSYIQWHGRLHFQEKHTEGKKKQAIGGYAAVTMDTKKPIDLRDFTGFNFEIRSKTDLTITFNMKCDSLVENDLYQLPFHLKASDDWNSLYAPFRDFILTAGGKEKVELKKNDSLQLTQIGFLLTTERSEQGTGR